MFLEYKLVRFQLLFVIISLTIAGEKICSHLAKFILLCRAALESTYLLTGAYILGVHEILTPCVIKQHFSIHCQVSHKVRINALQCNKELSSQPNGNFAAYIWWWDTVQLDCFTCFHMSLLSSTSRVLIPLSLRTLLFLGGIIYNWIWTSLCEASLTRQDLLRWWIRNSPAYVSKEFAPARIAIHVERLRIVSLLCYCLTISIVERYDSITLTYSHAVFIRRIQSKI